MSHEGFVTLVNVEADFKLNAHEEKNKTREI